MRRASLAIAVLLCSAAFGQEAVPLNGPWKFHTGDDLRWADLKFDDSGWEQYFIDKKHPSPDVAEVLQAGILPGWQGSFATCLAAQISEDGAVEIANAGHLPPYVNGREIELSGALPLGVVRATERTRAISAQPARAIAEAAKQFGQEDDITVVAIQRVPVPAYA